MTLLLIFLDINIFIPNLEELNFNSLLHLKIKYFLSYFSLTQIIFILYDLKRFLLNIIYKSTSLDQKPFFLSFLPCQKEFIRILES